MIFEFKDPAFLWLLLTLPLLAYLFSKKGKDATILFSSTELIKNLANRKRRGLKGFFLLLRLLTLALLILALARPQLGKGQSYTEASGIDIVLALDLSGSMLALDFSTKTQYITRIDAAKKVISEFIEKRQNDRIGVIAFAGSPYLVSPLTINHDWLISNIERLKVGLIEDGTAIGNAIAMSVNRLKDLKSKSKIIILLTDGENNSGNIPPLTAAEIAEKFNTKIYTIAIGKTDDTFMFALDKNGEIIKDAYGNPTIFPGHIPIDTETLQEIADITGAHAFRASSPEELEKIYSSIDKLEKTKIKIKKYATYEEFFMIPLLLALSLIGLELLLTNTRFRKLP